MRKYRNKITHIDGYRFMSKKEADRYMDLKLLLRNGNITDLELQPVYPIVIAGKRICKVILDFRYKDKRSGEIIHEDVKGYDNQLSKLKRKILEAMYGFKVVLI